MTPNGNVVEIFDSIQGEGDDRKIIARFPVYGLKKILVRAVTMEFLD